MKRRKKQLKAATMLQIGIAGVLLILLVLFVVWYSDGLNSFKPEGATYLYVAGVKIEQSGNAVYRNKEGIIEVSDQNGDNQVSGIPILYEGEEPKITLTKNMLLTVPTQGLGVKRVNYFTTITEKGGLSTLTSDGKKAQVRGGFLYDGEDTYILLENTTLKIGNNEVSLAPLSYVTVVYQKFVEYHNSADNKHEYIGLAGVNVYGKTESGYTLDFCKDAINTNDGEFLLFTAVDSIPVLKMEK